MLKEQQALEGFETSTKIRLEIEDIEAELEPLYAELATLDDQPDSASLAPSPHHLRPHRATIDRYDVLDLFHELMQPNSRLRVLRLLGEPKLGKSHLATKIFPRLAENDYHAQPAVLDLRNQTQTIPDIMQLACTLLNTTLTFPTYQAAYHDWLNRPLLPETDLATLLVQVQLQGEAATAQRPQFHQLTINFTTDLRQECDRLVLLIFDQLDDASEPTRHWLMDTLLVQLALIPHVRVVVAGRTVPEPFGSYAALCHTHELRPVQDVAAYVDYCAEIGAELEESAIQALAQAFDFKPGAFADVMPKFIRREASYG